MQSGTKLITVLDVDSRDEAMSAVEAARGCEWFKVGFQLFTRCGPPMVRELIESRRNVFLDLKFHDIPNTVGKAALAAADLGASLFTLHACGGRRMIAAARAGVEGSETRILAVTVLTSLSEQMLREEVGLDETPGAAVARYARMACESGAHGLVCSPREIGLVREAVGPDPLIVTPGVRPSWAGADDQERTLTPGEAARAGADFVVVGRPILKHPQPEEAVRMILEELNA